MVEKESARKNAKKYRRQIKRLDKRELSADVRRQAQDPDLPIVKGNPRNRVFYDRDFRLDRGRHRRSRRRHPGKEARRAADAERVRSTVE